MRRLVAYRENITKTVTVVNIGKLAVFYTADTLISGKTFIHRFLYNNINYSVIAKLPNETIEAADLNGFSIPLTDTIIPIDSVERSSQQMLPINMGEKYAQYTGGVIVFTYNLLGAYSFLMYSDTVSTQKVFTEIAHAACILDVTTGTDPKNVTSEARELMQPPIEIDLDEQTSLGVNVQPFDLTDPDRLILTHSNAFTIPRTSKNDQLHGFFGLSDDVYKSYLADYYVDNLRVISNGRLFVSSVGERINCNVKSKDSGFVQMEKTLWGDFMNQYYQWLLAEEPTLFTFTSLANLVDTLSASTEHLTIKGLYGYFNINNGFAKEYENQLVINEQGLSSGHICIYIKSLFQFIESKFGVSFFEGEEKSIFTLSNYYISSPYFSIRTKTASDLSIGFQSEVINPTTLERFTDKGERSVRDFVRYIIKHTISVLDQFSNTSFSIRPFSHIEEAERIDLSGKIKDSIIFSPQSDKIGQTSLVDFENYADGLTKGSVATPFNCENKNLEAVKNYITINGHIPKAYLYNGIQILGLFDKGVFKNFTLLEDSENLISFNLKSYPSLYSSTVVIRTIPVAKIAAVNVSGLQKVFGTPKIYTVEKWLSPIEVLNMKGFAKYYIKELFGNYYLNSMSGFNPETSLEPTTLELILIDRKMVDVIPTYTWSVYGCELDGVDNSGYKRAKILNVGDATYSILDWFGATSPISSSSFLALSAGDYATRLGAFYAFILTVTGYDAETLKTNEPRVLDTAACPMPVDITLSVEWTDTNAGATDGMGGSIALKDSNSITLDTVQLTIDEKSVAETFTFNPDGIGVQFSMGNILAYLSSAGVQCYYRWKIDAGSWSSNPFTSAIDSAATVFVEVQTYSF